MSVRVRAMVGADLAHVERVYRRNVDQPLPAASLSVVARALEGEGGLAWVATDAAGQVVGYIVGEVRGWEFGSQPAGWVLGVGVDPALQQQGVGETLLRALLDGFRARGVDTVRTMVRREDVRLLRLFRSAGFASGPYTQLELGLDGGARDQD